MKKSVQKILVSLPIAEKLDVLYLEKEKRLFQHVGWEQVSDIQSCGDPLSPNQLAEALIENAQNQTGIELLPEEEKKLKIKVKSLYCK